MKSNGSSAITLAGQSVVVFDRTWHVRFAGIPITVELRMTTETGGVSFQVTASMLGATFTQRFPVTGDVSFPIPLPVVGTLVVDVNGWDLGATQISFDLAIRVTPPFQLVPPLTVISQRIVIPRGVAAGLAASGAAPPSSLADYVALLQLLRPQFEAAAMPAGATAPAGAGLPANAITFQVPCTAGPAFRCPEAYYIPDEQSSLPVDQRMFSIVVHNSSRTKITVNLNSPRRGTIQSPELSPGQTWPYSEAIQEWVNVPIHVDRWAPGVFGLGGTGGGQADFTVPDNAAMAYVELSVYPA